jgi:Lactate racemase N-terminal domain
MTNNGHIPIEDFRILERTSASMPAVRDLSGEIRQSLTGLGLPREKLSGRRIAVTAGSRGIANLKEIVKAVCEWLKGQGAQPFVIPAMGSHGGATAEGQLAVLADYGVTPEGVGVEVRSDMETVPLGQTPEGFQVFMDRNAWEADSVVVLNRVKPHTDFSGNIESGLLKMITVGMGKRDGARETHRWSRKVGFERVIRAVSGVTLATGKILCGLAVVENDMHQIATLEAALPEAITAMEEATLPVARRLVPRLPFSKFQLLVVNEMGKNVSGTGMDTKVVGRGVRSAPGEAPEIGLIYVRDLTDESAGNAAGIGLADVMHERLYRKIDLQKTYVNIQTSLNPSMGRLPMYLASDRRAFNFALATLGSPGLGEQRIIWIQNTLDLNRIAVTATLARDAAGLPGWQLAPGGHALQFDDEGNLTSSFSESH